jgi:hypothetical protein
MKWLEEIKTGDRVVRMLAGTVPMTLKVTDVTDDRIVCGAWAFSRANGAEIDEDLGWDENLTGSLLVEKVSEK